VVTSPRGTVVEILQDEPERFALRRTLPPGTGRTAPHRHLNGIERFTVLSGTATGKVGRRHVSLREGDVMDVPVGATHVHPHTSARETAVVEHVIEPRPRFVEVYFASWQEWLAAGRVDGQDEPTLLGIMAVIDAGGGGTWVSGPPIALQKAVVPVMARLARRRGYVARG
jgi:mannose-6-phosphate isomerase-like protein (cupin superfamily)